MTGWPTCWHVCCLGGESPTRNTQHYQPSRYGGQWWRQVGSSPAPRRRCNSDGHNNSAIPFDQQQRRLQWQGRQMMQLEGGGRRWGKATRAVQLSRGSQNKIAVTMILLFVDKMRTRDPNQLNWQNMVFQFYHIFRITGTDFQEMNS